MTDRPASVLDLLELGLGRVRRGWTQFAPARKANGVPCDPAASAAVEWCSTGAVAIEPECALARRKALAALSAAVPDVTPLDIHHIRLTHWNDARGRTQADCVRLYENAVARERASSSSGTP